jgi:hypothetical protein
MPIKWCDVCLCYRGSRHKCERNNTDKNNTEQPIQDIIYEAQWYAYVDRPMRVNEKKRE